MGWEPDASMIARNKLPMTAAHKELTEKVIGAGYQVYNRMGYGFVESVYERCLTIELRKLGMKVEPQMPITVYYDGQVVGEFIADLLVDDVLLIELKSVRALAPAHEVQLVNYLVATGKEVGLLVNFGEKGVEIKRKLKVLPAAQATSPATPGSGAVAAPNPVDPVNPV